MIDYCDCETKIPYEDKDGKTWCNRCVRRIKNVRELPMKKLHKVVDTTPGED